MCDIAGGEVWGAGLGYRGVVSKKVKKKREEGKVVITASDERISSVSLQT